MLEYSKTEEGYIKVTEKLMSFTDTKISTVLYDLENKRKKLNKEDWRQMNQSDINWVTKYYLPKVV